MYIVVPLYIPLLKGITLVNNTFHPPALYYPDTSVCFVTITRFSIFIIYFALVVTMFQSLAPLSLLLFFVLIVIIFYLLAFFYLYYFLELTVIVFYSPGSFYLYYYLVEIVITSRLFAAPPRQATFSNNYYRVIGPQCCYFHG